MIKLILMSHWIESPLGKILALADEEKLYLLEFETKKNLNKSVNKLLKDLNAEILNSSNAIINSIKQELAEYFAGSLKKFNTPIYFSGSDFQKKSWQELCKIPYGETRSYSMQAKLINMPKAFRAVANANGANNLAIIVPCHRIINNNGALGGYSGGLEKKKWLLAHENKNI